MAPRRAAAVSAASSISQAAGPSSNVEKESAAAAQGRQSLGSQKPSSRVPSVLPIVPVQPLSPIVSRLRKMWKFAAICQFLFTFDGAFGMSGFETEALENDLGGTERKVIPDLMRRLLYTLTLNMDIDEHNWEDHLRAQYLKRHPEETILGTAEDPFPWSGLPLRQKVETLHQACEWQLWDAERFRKLVKNDEDAHVWRIDPIGWDVQDNTYWLFDDNRLWIQHPRPAPLKAKAPPKKNGKKAKLEAAAAKRAAQQVQKRKRKEVKPKSTPTRSSARNRISSSAIETPVLKRGRTSRSSRRSTGKDGWEEIPAELLYGEGGNGRVKNDDEDSDLSDPPPVEDEDVSMMEDNKVEINRVHLDESVNADMSVDVQDEEAGAEINGKEEEEEDKEPKQEEKGEKTEVEKPAEEEEWIEFETIAVTKQEWEAISIRFAKSKHPDEKSLYQLIQHEVLPKVMADLEEAEKQRAHEAAMANRKRSSRIALKESEREEKERDRVARLKMEERMSTIRAEEAQQLAKEKEEKDLAKLREERLREREERMLARERELIEKAEREIMERENREKLREMRKLKREQILANGGVINESEELQQHKEADEDSWELDCEVCGKAGINLDDTDEIVCCETCGKWQHTECWNSFDRSIGRASRNWEKEDFFCSTCKPPAEGQFRPQRPIKQDQAAAAPLPATSTPGVSQKKALPKSNHGATSIVQQQPIMSSNIPMQPNMYNNHYNALPQMPTSYGQIQQRSPQHQGIPLQQTSQQQYRQYSPQQLAQHQQPQMPSSHQYNSQSPTPPPRQQYPRSPSPFHKHQSQLASPHQAYSQLQSNHQQQFQHPQQQYQQRQPAPYTQQQQQQPLYFQAPHYATSGHGHTNGFSNVSNAQTPQRNSAVHSQIPPQHMQRPPPVQSPVMQQPVWQQSTLQHAAQGSQRPTPLTPTNGSKMDMPAPLPTSQATNASTINSKSTAGSSNLQTIASPGSTLPNSSTSPRGPTTSTPSVAVSLGPAKSPSPSSKVSPSVPRSLASLPSGSFPLRHSTARSPLSRPEGYTSPSIPQMTLGPSAAGRATSPSPIKKSPTLSTTLDPLLNRQSVVANSNQSASSQGPGPSTGSLARSVPSSVQSSAAPNSSPSVQAPLQLQQQAKSLGPSPPRPVFGADLIRPTQSNASNTSTLPSTQIASAVTQPISPQAQQNTD